MKSQLKQTVIAVLTSAVLFAAPAANASGIPTVDAAAIAQGVQNMVMDISNQAEQMAEWQKQFDNMVQQITTLQNQLEQQKAHYEAITKARGIGKADAIVTAITNAPDEWADIYKTIQDINPTATLKKIEIDPDREVKDAAVLKEQAEKDYNSISTVLKDLEDIGKRIKNNEVNDQKDAADLANRILANMATVTTIAAQYDIMEKEREREQDLSDQKLFNRSQCIREAKNKTERQKCYD
ncbi:MAG: hypothetical protein J5680_04585 [Neisseriaceae bacterium]|nr:hypothetical protein [Neisseriaceae bacterium]